MDWRMWRAEVLEQPRPDTSATMRLKVGRVRRDGTTPVRTSIETSRTLLGSCNLKTISSEFCNVQGAVTLLLALHILSLMKEQTIGLKIYPAPLDLQLKA
jgi:hypothetical protein